MRYVVLTIAGTRSVATPPFGTCSSRARLLLERGRVVVRMPGFSNVGPAGPEQQFYLEADRMASTVPDPDAPTMGNLSYAPSFECTAGASPTAADAMLAAFEADYPKALVDPATVELQQLAPATLQRIVADLGCLAGQVGGDAFIPEQAVALFASRRHGAAAFAALDVLARSGDAAAERFLVQMRGYTSAH